MRLIQVRRNSSDQEARETKQCSLVNSFEGIYENNGRLGVLRGQEKHV